MVEESRVRAASTGDDTTSLVIVSDGIADRTAIKRAPIDPEKRARLRRAGTRLTT